ncbi:hypothetical protein C3B44_01120 [Corynebacterium yudongzhengii]|nr:hypothetical protein C3B44_01120 [Corynebacterium yudongzhengii]
MQRVCSRSEGQWLETSHQPTSCGIPRPIRGLPVNHPPHTNYRTLSGAEANGQSYSITIHNGLTGRYSFNVD